MATDTLSLHVQSDADEATKSIQRLNRHLRSLLKIMQSLESASGLGELKDSLQSASAAMEKATGKSSSGMKKTAKEAKQTAEALNEVKKAVGKDINPNVDTKPLKDAQEQMKKLSDGSKEARKKTEENLHDVAGWAMQQQRAKFPRPEAKSEEETASGWEEIKENVDAARQATDKFTESAKKAADATKNASEMPEWMKNDPALQAQRERAMAASAGVRQESAAALSEYERGVRQDAWINAGAVQSQSTYKDRDAQRRERVRESFNAYQEQAQQAEQAASANEHLASATQKVVNAQMQLRAQTAGASGAMGRLNPLVIAASGSTAGLGTRLKYLPWRLAINGSNMLHGAVRKLGQGAKSAGGFLKGFLQGFVGTTFKAAFGAPMRMMRGLLNVGTFGMLGKAAKESQSALGGISGAVGKGLTGIMRYVLGFRTLFYLVRAIRQGIAEGFTNLASVNEKTNQSLSMLKSRLTQVKNGMATAFAPVLNAVAPVLNTLIGYLMDGINAIAQFFAALTGQSTWQKAVYKMQDFSGAADSAGSSASDANDKANELKKTLMSFDKINKLDDADSSSGGGGGGGGGGGNGAAGAGMFSTETVSTGISNFAQMVKDAWKDADFTEVGTVIGTKLRDALDQIPWDEKIKPMAAKVGKSLGTLITGFVTTPGLPQTIGTTIAQALNTFLTGINEFVKGVNWIALGSFITTSIQTAFRKFDWELAGNTFGNLASAVFDLVSGAIQGIDWKSLPGDIVTGIKKFLKGVDWGKLFGSMGTLAGSIAGAIRDIIKGGLDLLGWDDDADLLENGKNIMNGIINGIKAFFTGGIKWAKDVLSSFVEGFRDAFDMHSPSKATEITNLGKDIIEGVFSGITSWFTGIGTWIKEHIFDPFCEKFSSGWAEFKKNHPTLTGWFSDLFGGDAEVPSDIGTKITVDAEETENYKEIMRGNNGYVNIKDETVTKTADGKKGSLFDTIGNWWKDISGTKDATKKVNGQKGNLFDAVGNWWNSFNRNKDATVKVNAKETSKKKGMLQSLAGSWSKFKEGTSVKGAVIKAGAEGVSNFTKAIEAWNKFKPKAKDNTKKATLTLESKGVSISAFNDVYNTMNRGASSRTLTVKAEVPESTKRVLRAWSNVQDNPTQHSVKDLINAPGGSRGAVIYGGVWHNIPQYAAGGVLPSHGSLLIAGEAGAETVGHINGRTEVLNQSQMAAVMYSAVLRGMSQAMAQYGNGGGQEIRIIPDPKGIFRVVQAEANAYTNTTGRPAFNI